MKTKQVATIVITLLIGFSTGLMSGIVLMKPDAEITDAAGSIGRLDQYRNVQTSAEDIQLRNELLENAEMRALFMDYMKAQYAGMIRMSDDIKFALTVSDATPGFEVQYGRTVESLRSYSKFLDNARLRMLAAISMLQIMDETSEVAIHSAMRDALNAMAQTSFRSDVLHDFMRDAENYASSGSENGVENLMNAHDRFLMNLISLNLMNGNRAALEQLLAKAPAGTGTRDTGMKETLQQGLSLDSEQLAFFDSEQLGTLWDSEQLGMQLLDSEQLNAMGLWDSEQLSAMGLWDSEQLAGSTLFDSELLQGFMAASEQLKAIIPW